MKLIAGLLILFCVILGCQGRKVSYSFKYSIDRFNLITHHEEERKDDSVHGFYSLLQPDGRVRLVEYRVEGNKGFRAFVKYNKPGSQAKGYLQFPQDFRKPIILQNPIYQRNW
ncbi:uncharacterized protein LOC109605339 [Aethina tumida]|uniref:uncharacterized protein LOC109605339 n=1 Tax=Aethina tumida TaxID=116153 RepID=UPI00096B254F|nr:uncharacterized protein LOC109605339 [Aethina tumida]